MRVEGSDEVVPLQRQIFEKRLGDLTTDRMQPAIFRPRAAITIAIKSRHGRETAGL